MEWETLARLHNKAAKGKHLHKSLPFFFSGSSNITNSFLPLKYLCVFFVLIYCKVTLIRPIAHYTGGDITTAIDRLRTHSRRVKYVHTMGMACMDWTSD